RAAVHSDLPSYLETKARCLSNLGMVLRRTDRLEQAVDAHGQAAVLRTKLAEKFPSNGNYRLSLAISQINIGAVWNDLGKQRRQNKRPEAEKAYRQALPLLEKLAEQHKANPRYQQDLALVHNNLGAVLQVAGQVIKAEEHYGQALSGFQKLVDAYSMIPDYLHELARSQHGLGLLLKKTGKAPRAEKALSQSVVNYQKLTKDFGNVVDYREGLGTSLFALAELQGEMGQLTK